MKMLQEGLHFQASRIENLMVQPPGEHLGLSAGPQAVSNHMHGSTFALSLYTVLAKGSYLYRPSIYRRDLDRDKYPFQDGDKRQADLEHFSS